MKKSVAEKNSKTMRKKGEKGMAISENNKLKKQLWKKRNKEIKPNQPDTL